MYFSAYRHFRLPLEKVLVIESPKWIGRYVEYEFQKRFPTGYIIWKCIFAGYIYVLNHPE